jgi:hypothetical protein
MSKKLTVAEIAIMFKVSKQSVMLWIKNGLPTEKEKVIGIKTRRVIDPDDVKKYQLSRKDR